MIMAFLRHERRHPEPLLHLPTLLLRPIALTNLTTLLLGLGLFGFSTIITQYLQVPTRSGYGIGASPTQAALYVMPGLLMIMATSPVVIRLATRVGAKVVVVLGCAIGCLGLLLITTVRDHQIYLYLWPLLLYVGAGFAFAALPMLILDAVPPQRRAEATALNMVSRCIGSGVGSQIAATFITASVGASRLPSGAGYTRAFMVGTVGAAGAMLVALAIPGRLRRRPPREVTTGVGLDATVAGAEVA
jgi:MFS family permease